MKSFKPIILVDGSSYFFRAFHALPPLTNSQGNPTGAIYGVINMIKRLIKDYSPEQMAVIFDTKGKTFRDELYEDYKAHRPPMPDDLSCQFFPLVDLLKAMGIPVLMLEGIEADDIIGTLTQIAVLEGHKVVISTSDKDMAQLVTDQIICVNTMSNQVLDIAGVEAKFGVKPSQMIDYLTLIGDSVDNIPGVTKCGPKTAVKWLTQYGSLDNLINHVDEISGKIGEYLRASLTHLPLTKTLVTIKTDIDLGIDPEHLIIKNPDPAKLIELVKKLEFKNWLKELLTNNNTDATLDAAEVNTPDFDIIVNHTDLKKLATQLINASHCYLHVYASDLLNPIGAKLIGIAIAVEEGRAIYLPLCHEINETQLSQEQILNALKPALESNLIKKIGHDLKYSWLILNQYGIKLNGIEADTMVSSYILDSNASKHDLDPLTLKYLGTKILSLEEIIGKGAKQVCISTIDINSTAKCAAHYITAIQKLHAKFTQLLSETAKNLLREIEVPLITVLAQMENHGVLVDCNTLMDLGKKLKTRIIQLEQQVIDITGSMFNLNSPKQLQEILFQQQKLPVITKTPTGQPSTAEAVLQELAYEYPLPALILEYRSLTKLVSTYIEALPKCINHKSNRIHTSYNQAITSTGRLSSSNPNLQNIPIKSGSGRLIRAAFIAPSNHSILAADYSQIELRIMAHLSKEPNLIKAFAAGWDIHAATASEIFSVELNKVTQEQRRSAKAVNFGLIYGMSSFGLAKQLGIDRNQAQNYIQRYFERYPKVLDYMEQTRISARQKGYVETIFGRRLYLPEINTSNTIRQKAAERAAINAPMQGSAADIIKKAMIDIDSWLTETRLNCTMIMQVHDELVFEVYNDLIELVQTQIKSLMENAVTLLIPLEVSIGSGKNWDQAHN